jgi:hypothetical protein
MFSATCCDRRCPRIALSLRNAVLRQCSGSGFPCIRRAPGSADAGGRRADSGRLPDDRLVGS